MEIIKRNHRYVTGEEVKHIGFTGYSSNDAGHFNARGVRAGCYAPGGGSDKKSEWIDIRTMVTCYRVLVLCALEVCTSERVSL